MKSITRLSLLLSLGVSCAKSGGGLLATPSICTMTKSSDAIVECQITAGAQITVAEANLQPTSGPFSNTLPVATVTDVVAIAVNATNPIKGNLTGSVSAFGFAWDVNSTSTVGPRYADGTIASGYCFLAKNNGRWVLESTGFFRRDQLHPADLYNDNLYVEGINEQAFLSSVATSAASSTVCGPPVLPPPLVPRPDAGLVWPDSGPNDSPQDAGPNDGGV